MLWLKSWYSALCSQINCFLCDDLYLSASDTGFAAAEVKQKVCSYFKYNLLFIWFEAIVSISHSSLLSPMTSTASVKM